MRNHRKMKMHRIRETFSTKQIKKKNFMESIYKKIYRTSIS